MIRNLLNSIRICSVIVLLPLSLKAEEVEIISFSETFGNSQSGDILNVQMLDKNQRTSKYSSKIVIVNEGELRDEVKKCLYYAASVWENNMPDMGTIRLQICEEEIEEDIRTDVQTAIIGNMYFPLTLKRYINKESAEAYSAPDAVITVKSPNNWDYNIGDDISDRSKNLAFGFMRAIARVLGFGSCITISEEDGYVFKTKRMHYIFHTLVEDSSGNKLIDIPLSGGRKNPYLTAFIEKPSETFWVVTKNSRFELQSPPYTLDNLPFLYVKDSKSLMRGNVNQGDFFLQIDNGTKEILHEIGWANFNEPTLSIASSDLDATGLGCAYQPHEFYIVKESVNIVNPEWRLVVPLKNGDLKEIYLQDNNLSCTVPIIENPDLYQINQDGDIKCKLYFSCMIDGKEVNAKPYTLTLELAPFIEKVDVIKIVDNSPYKSYDVHYRVKYRGSETIHVSVEEEYSSILKSKYIKEPYIVEGIASHITSPYCAWIDFQVENQYGEATYTIELGPYGEILQCYRKSDFASWNQSRIERKIDSVEDKYDVMDTYGRKIAEINNLGDLDKIDYKGLLIIVQKRGNNIINSYKILK